MYPSPSDQDSKNHSTFLGSYSRNAFQTSSLSSKKRGLNIAYDEESSRRDFAVKNERLPQDMRITELLDRNLAQSIQQEPTRETPMEGDLPALRNEFCMRVKIGWPYASMLPPQRQMSLHILKALESSKHVVIESPTGTGKSAAILCSTLAWQRYHHQITGEKIKIIYCSRTHSQVAQMVASLRGTPYRPRMAVLGSRDRLCIHPTARNGSNVNNECRIRTRATEVQRRSLYQSAESYYNDNDPPAFDSDEISSTNDDKEKPTCAQYRQLTATRTSSSAISRFPYNETFDIEDLVGFGRNPYQRTVYLRKRADEKWGLVLYVPKDSLFPKVERLVEQGIACKDGSILPGQYVFEINGKSTESKHLDDIANQLRTSQNITLRVGSDSAEMHQHSCCPYYLSRALEKHAEIVFCPYQYVLDPVIRKSLNIELENRIVVLDEAHNVEDCLRTGGSGNWSEFVWCDMISALVYFTNMDSSIAGKLAVDPTLPDDKVSVNQIAHDLLLFLEPILLFMLDAKKRFEQNGEAENAINEWQRFRTSDDTKYETSYDGPNGIGIGGRPVGCKTFFDKTDLASQSSDKMRQLAEAMSTMVRERKEYEHTNYGTIFDNMIDAVSKLAFALEEPEHYFIQSQVKANGSLRYASGNLEGGHVTQRTRERKPKVLPLAPGRTRLVPNAPLAPCKFCASISGGHTLITENGQVKHALYCTGATPQWEVELTLELLTPARFMRDLSTQCRSVILASGSLAPLGSLCGELGLTAEDTPKLKTSNFLKVASPAKSRGGRLQIQPPPLEANHVINLEKQLLAVAIGHFPDGEKLTVSYNQYKHDQFIIKLGEAIASVVESIPRGGVLVFLPSYSLLRKCIKIWTGAASFGDPVSSTCDVWERLRATKGKVMVEPTGNQAEFEAARDEYAETIRTTGHCVLFAVFRGKMSEGISFNDDNARGVICVGIPYPSSFDRTVKAKKSYNDEQRKLSNRNELLPGDMWYSQQAYRALAQALGRCIRHAADYGVIILMDSRHCDESPADQSGTCLAHKNLPKWMRSNVRTLSMHNRPESDRKILCGGWIGLQSTMESFFDEAPLYVRQVVQEHQNNLVAARERATVEMDKRTFDKQSGKWIVAEEAVTGN